MLTESRLGARANYPEGMSTRVAARAGAVPVLIVGVVAMLVSAGRLWLTDRSALTEVLWAEDGLFPLCIRKADFATCLGDPFAGYLLLLPRLLAWPVSVAPWESWAIAANVLAAVLAGLVSAGVLVIARRFGLGWFVSIVLALLPVIAPMTGLEAINALGSSYMLLLYISALVIVLPPADRSLRDSRPSLILIALLLLLTALTIPSSVVLLAALLIMLLRARIAVLQAGVWAAAIALGLVAQFFVAINAEVPRAITFGTETLNAWADAIPVALLTYWPGLTIGEYPLFTNFTLSPVGITGWLMVAILGLVGLGLIVRGNERQLAAGALLWSGLGLGLIPSAIGVPNNRYFVVPLLLWGAAVLVLLDPVIRRTRWWITAAITAVVLVVWWPALPASTFRATPAPPWTTEVQRIEAQCAADPGFVDRPLFTHFWPPNWGDGLSEPSHPNLPCTVVWRWLE